ncbi:MAG: hypothetical protein ACLR8P_16030 [Clostridium fessum]
MSDLFANPLEEMIEIRDLKTDLQRGQGPLLVTGCLIRRRCICCPSFSIDAPC